MTMLKLTIKGTPEEVAAFNALLQAAKVEIEYASDGRKWSATDKWCSQVMGINLPEGAAPAPALAVKFNERKPRGKRGKGAPKDKSGYVYLLPATGVKDFNGNEIPNAYKIGKTTNPDSRRDTFGTKYPFQVAFVALIKTDDCGALETQLRRRFSKQQIGRSEFHRLEPEDIEFIKAMEGGQ
jgi:hypothetical protein